MRRFLGWLLFHANKNPEDRASFYPIKEKILRRWGRRVGDDLQHIPGKRCNRCKNGLHWHFISDMHMYGWEECWHCGGTGWYKSEKWVLLHNYDLGGYRFHIPGSTFRGEMQKPALPIGGEVIEGYIEHWSNGQFWLDDECELWLYVLFCPLKIPTVAYLKSHYIADVPLYLPILFCANAANKLKELD